MYPCFCRYINNSIISSVNRSINRSIYLTIIIIFHHKTMSATGRKKYKDLGARVSKSTTGQRKTATNHFNEFLKDVDSKYSFDTLTDEYITPELFGEFTDYLMTKAKINMLETVLSYCSDVKMVLSTKYPNSVAFRRDTVWYTKVRANMEALYYDQAEASGTDVRDRRLECGEDHISFMSDLMFRQILRGKLCYHDRLLIIRHRHMLGRILEVARIKWLSIVWSDVLRYFLLICLLF